MPYWRLAAAYLVFFGTLGAFVPYWSLYLQAQGLDPAQIGELLGLFMATRIVAPNLIAWWSYASTRDHTWLLGLAVCTTLGFSLSLRYTDYLGLLLMMALFGFGWHALLPQMESFALRHLGSTSARYGQIRGWGSLGFILTVVGVGVLLDSGYPIAHLPLLLCGMLMLLCLLLLSLPSHPSQVAAGVAAVPLSQVLRQPAVIGFIVASFLAQASHAPYYGFYSLLLAQQGYTRIETGQLWALGVVAEIGVFAAMHWVCLRYSLRTLFLTSLLLTAVRWLLIGFGVAWLSLLLLAQILHAASFGLYHATAMQFIERHFQGHHRHSGQALYNSLGFGAGGAIGNLASGYLWRYDPTVTYLAAAGLALLGAWVIWRWVDDAQPQWQAEDSTPERL